MKKIIKALIVVMMLTMVVMAFTGCLDQIIPKEDPCKDGHTMEAFAEEPATCTEDGLSAGVVCTVCGYEERTRFTIPAKGHKMADATCTDPSTCTVCGHTEGEALGHSLVLKNGQMSTCTEVGYTAHKACERCDYTEGKEEVAIDPNAHTLVDVEALDPTCTEAGYTAHKACECGYTEGKEDLDIIPHNFSVEVEALEPTTCVDGHTAHKKCEVCGTPDDSYKVVSAPHSFNDESYFYYPAPTCTEGGYLAGTCTECGYSFYLEELAPLGHTYVYGICSVCEAQDPEYVDYYLVGWINGADYGCEADHANLGEYKFVDGKLTVTFAQDSYVFVKTGNLEGKSVKWYLFQSYTTGKEGTLYENKSEKMFIPGNVEVVFTLTVNEDGSLTLVADYHVQTALSNAVLDLTTKDNRTYYDAADKQVWEANGIKLTNTKGENTNNIPDKAPFQVNSKGSLIIEGKGIKTIVIVASNTTYGTYFNNILTAVENPNFTYVKNGNTFTITLNEVVDIFQIDNLAKATAFKTITINPEA